ncbi:MAG: ABC transporter ATP-binding protein [Clostridiales bacterium]|nr:ABC transporter ATP-binding protein [Clostridiales bacterium]
MTSLIRFEKVCRSYGSDSSRVTALDDIDFSIELGEFTVVLGPSGAGKSTLLNILGGMDRASSGIVRFGQDEITGFNDARLTRYRAEKIGFVFQFYNLIPNLTAFENVSLTREINRNALDPIEVLASVGLDHRINNFPSQLSGGEQQRVAIARALCKNPELLLCDEPTGALDSETGTQVLRLLQKLCFEEGRTVVVVTHNAQLTQLANRVIKLRDGRLIGDEKISDPIAATEVRW